MPAEVVHELPMRWADLDSLNHVNNVVYVDYAAEARAILVDQGLLPDRPASTMTIRFLRPLLLSRHPVAVASTVDGDVLTQQVCVQDDDSRTVFAEVVTVLGRREPLERHPAAGNPLPSRVRRSDLDASGAVSATKVFELFQEGRILHLTTGLGSISPGQFVVGTVEVTHVRAITWQVEPYDMRSWLSRVGAGSVTIESEMSDGDTVLARATSILVGFDLERQKSRKLSEAERTQLDALVS